MLRFLLDKFFIRAILYVKYIIIIAAAGFDCNVKRNEKYGNLSI